MKTTPLSQAARPAPSSGSQPIPQRTVAAAAATAAQAPINRSASASQAATAVHSAPTNSYATPSSTSTVRSASSTPAPSHAAAPSNTSRAVSTTVAGPASTSKPAGVSDYRNNIDRQSREQKSVGGILSLVVYGLIALFVIGTGLAAYGAHDVYRQLHSQSLTVSDLDSRYSTENEELNNQLKVTEQSVIQLQGQISHAQDLALRQQDAIAKLQTSLDAEVAALREERATRAAETSIRASETSALRTRIRNLEKNEITFHP
jgi:cell division protein FtsB